MDNSFSGNKYSSQYKDKSPITRSGIERGSAFKTSQRKYNTLEQRTIDEEEEYHQRREAEVRRQIKQKDEELYNLNRASDYIKGRMDQPSQRMNYDQVNQSYGRSFPERDRSPYQEQVQREEQSVPTHLQDHISNLQNDNSSLMRRLNLVLQELDRVQQEKEELLTKLEDITTEQQKIQRLLNDEGKLDKINRYMQDDVVYERDRNMKVRQKIKEEELYKTELLRELRKQEGEQEQQSYKNQNLNSDLQNKIKMIQDLEKEHYYTREKIKEVSQAIEQTKVLEIHESDDKNELSRIVYQLQQERNDLFNRLENLSLKYEECVKDISIDRNEMEFHNKRHAQLISAKIMFQSIEMISQSKIREGFSYFKQYCEFDIRCHKKLQSLSKVMNRIGIFKQKLGLTMWFQKALQPIKTKIQNELISEKISNDTLKSKMFYKWNQAYKMRIEKYDMKTQAIQQIWQIKNKDSQIELKRALTIWKDCLFNYKQRENKVKKLIWKLYFNKLSKAMNEWTNYSKDVDSQVRLNLLSQEFAKRQYLTLLFNKFRYQITEQKRKRLNKLAHIWKAWQDYLNHKKYKMGANVAIMQFLKTCNETILKQCFDALRLNKENEKLLKASEQLNNKELVEIDELSDQIQNKEQEELFKKKVKACECLKTMMEKQVFSYLQRWKELNNDYKEKLRTNVKDRILKRYYQVMRTSFNQWKVNHNQTKLFIRKQEIQEQQQESNYFQNEIMGLQKHIKEKQEYKEHSQIKNLQKCMNSLLNRRLQQAIARWRDNVNILNFQQEGAYTIIKRLKTRLLRNGFNLYCEGVKYQKKKQVEEQRCAYYNKIRNDRLLKNVVKNWNIYKNNFQQAKNYWNRIFLRLEVSMKDRALKRWYEQTQKIQEQEQLNTQQDTIDHLDALNHQIGELAQVGNEQESDIKQIKNKMTKQAQRVIANTFARFYYIGEIRGFEAWKQFVENQRRKEKILKRMIDHMRKYQFNQVHSFLRKWMLNADIQGKREQLKKEEQRLQDVEFAFQSQNAMYQAIGCKQEKELEQEKQQQELYNGRLQKSVSLIVNKAQSNDYMSNKRYILQQWSQYVKREKHFIYCIQNVIQKSLWKVGFSEIKSYVRKDQKQENFAKVLENFRIKFYQRTCGSAFSNWRSNVYQDVNESINNLSEQTNEIYEQTKEKLNKIKEFNSIRIEQFLNKKRLKDLWVGWNNVVKNLKQMRIKQEVLQEQFQEFQKRNSIIKWQGRKNATKLARMRIKKLQEKFTRLRKMLVFQAFKDVYNASRNFITRLSNFANIHDHQALKMGLNAIVSYVRSKNYVNLKKQEFATKEITSILNNLLLRKKNLYFNDMKFQTSLLYKQNAQKAFTIVYNLSNKMRTYFSRWRQHSDKISIVQEMNNEGPIREEVFEERQTYENCKNLLQEEGFTEKEIQEILKRGKEQKNNLMLKAIQRINHYNDDLYPKPLAFDRWRQYVHCRKLFKYWLQFSNKRVQHIQSDLAQAFDKWKYFDFKQKRALSQLPKAQIEQKIIKNNNVMDKLADQIEDKENVINNLNNQREALLENYIKGQKVALSVLIQRNQMTLEQGFHRWKANSQIRKNKNLEQNLQRNIEMIAALKDRLKILEKENEVFAEENEELRQFSLDGYEIAKNVQALAGEREKLSVDLADKSQTIRKLLDENEKLSTKLRSAQDEANSLIKSTGKYAATRSSFSPMMRGNAY